MAYIQGVNASDPRLKSHARRADASRHCIPYALHGDGVPCTKKDSLDVMSIHSLLGSGTSLDMKCMLHAFMKNVKWEGGGIDTMKSIWKIIIWSLTVLASGVFRKTDWNDQAFWNGSWDACMAESDVAFAGGFYFELWEIKADMDYLANVLKLEHWGERNHICTLCLADRSAGASSCWINFKPDASWKNTVWPSHQTWLAAHPSPHDLFLMGSVTIHHVQYDSLHIVDLGVTAHIVGNALLYLATSGMYPTTGALETVVEGIWSEVQNFYVTMGGFATKSRISNLTVSMFAQDGGVSTHFPSLRHMKAAESKNLAPAVFHVFQGYLRQDVEADQHMCACLGGLVAFYNHTDRRHGRFLLPVQVRAVQSSIDVSLAHYNWLTNWAIDNHKIAFNIVPKFHYWWHIGWQSQYANPGFTTTYLDEDYVGRIAIAARNCTSGTGLASISRKVAEHFVCGVQVRWWRASSVEESC